MIQITSHEQHKPEYYTTREGVRAWKTHYIGFSPGQTDPAQGWMLESAPGRVLQAHYHEVDQFQVVVEGEGLMGKHHVGPGYVHFSRAHTPYGPVVWGEQGMQLLTIRPSLDSAGGPKLMPESREKLKKTARNAFQLGLQVDFPDAESTMNIQPISGIQDDAGLSAHTITLKPGAQALAPDPSLGGGQWILVMQGSLIHEGRNYPGFSIAELTPDETAFRLQAGPQGAQVIVLSFSRRDRQGVHSKAVPAAAPATRTWLCELCGFVYDEAAGMPAEGIAAGTRWEDVPDSWGCPDCSGSKADFMMVEI